MKPLRPSGKFITRSSLLATVDALQRQVEDQEERLAKLESVFSPLLTPGIELTKRPSGTMPTAAPSYQIEGSLTIRPGADETVLNSKNYSNNGEGEPCSGMGEFDDVHGGMLITVNDDRERELPSGIQELAGLTSRRDAYCKCP